MFKRISFHFLSKQRGKSVFFFCGNLVATLLTWMFYFIKFPSALFLLKKQVGPLAQTLLYKSTINQWFHRIPHRHMSDIRDCLNLSTVAIRSTSQSNYRSYRHFIFCEGFPEFSEDLQTAWWCGGWTSCLLAIRSWVRLNHLPWFCVAFSCSPWHVFGDSPRNMQLISNPKLPVSLC